MIGAALATGISTMHEKACINLHYLWKKKKHAPKFSCSHISQSQWQNCEIIIDIDFLNHLNHTTQQNSYMINYIENQRIIYKSNTGSIYMVLDLLWVSRDVVNSNVSHKPPRPGRGSAPHIFTTPFTTLRPVEAGGCSNKPRGSPWTPVMAPHTLCPADLLIQRPGHTKDWVGLKKHAFVQELWGSP